MTAELGECTTAELNHLEAGARGQLAGDASPDDRRRLERRLEAIAAERESRRLYAEAIGASARRARP